MKVLLAGDVRGALGKLAARVKKLNASAHGPFDVCFAVGAFSGGGPEEGDLSDFIDGRQQFPIPLFFVSAGPVEQDAVLGGKGTMTPLARNITYLGRAGIVDVLGLRVAFLSGVHSTTHYAEPAGEAPVGRYVPWYTDSQVTASLLQPTTEEVRERAGVGVGRFEYSVRELFLVSLSLSLSVCVSRCVCVCCRGTKASISS
jgi:hypothetical protein